MKKLFSILVVLVCLLNFNDSFGQRSINTPETASVYWNFKVYEAINPLGGEGGMFEFNILTESTITPNHLLSVGFEGTPGANIIMTTDGSGIKNIGGGVTMDVEVTKMNSFNQNGEAWCDIVVKSITSSTTTGTFEYTHTVTVEYAP